MSDTIDAVMQAAELAQDIVDGNFPAVDISRRDPLYKQIDAGRKVAKALLSILPKNRPEPVTVDSLPIGARAWLHVDQHGCQGVYSVCSSIMRGDATCFATEEDATEDMRHDLLKMLAAFAS